MILPHPESDLSINIMVLGTEVIRFLKGRDFVLIEDIMESFIKNGKKRTPDLFLNTLVYLYACGMIEKSGYKVRLIQRKKTEQQVLF